MKKLLICNWKMVPDLPLALTLTRAAGTALGKREQGAEVVLAAPYIYLSAVRAILSGGVQLAAQDVAVPDHPKGAQTGDVSPAMLRAVGCDYVIVGHSERRARYGETSGLVRAKAVSAMTAGLTPVICVGETADERAAGRGPDVVRDMVLESVPFGVPGPTPVLTYEPVWAISGGRAGIQPATPDDIVAMHTMIHKILSEKLAPGTQMRMLYGASVRPDNAATILRLPYVDGALVGAASLDPDGLDPLVAAAVEAGR